MATSLEQHRVEIARNRDLWLGKPRLRAIYRDFYRSIADRIDPSLAGPVVELGSGIGAIKDVLPQCLTTDLFDHPWIDQRENAYRLSFDSATLSHLILFDVWHHLRYPGTALRELRRVLRRNGRLILFEPAASWTGRLVYGCFHHEPLGLNEPLTWEAPDGVSPDDADYFAAQGAATRLFWWKTDKVALEGWSVREVTPIVSFTYFASGGFSGKERGGALFQSALKQFDAVASRWPRLFAARLLVVLEKVAD